MMSGKSESRATEQTTEQGVKRDRVGEDEGENKVSGCGCCSSSTYETEAPKVKRQKPLVEDKEEGEDGSSVPVRVWGEWREGFEAGNGVVIIRDVVSSPTEREEGAASVLAACASHGDSYADTWGSESAPWSGNAPSSVAELVGLIATPPAEGEGWYVSFVVQNSEEGVGALRSALEAIPGVADLPHSDVMGLSTSACMWVFAGRNGGGEGTGRVVHGRPEHTDDVACDATWHIQLAGSKTWHLRRDSVQTSVTCHPGDVLVVDTKVWWHHTTFAPAPLCLSVARDIFFSPGSDDEEPSTRPSDVTNIEGLYAAESIPAGTIVFREDEMPGVALPRDPDNPNCQVVWLEEEGMGALIAARDIGEGEWFSVPPSDSDSDSDSDSER